MFKWQCTVAPMNLLKQFKGNKKINFVIITIIIVIHTSL